MGRGKFFLASGLVATTAITATFAAAAFTANATSHADYVIVGGGPAGLALAERLSRDERNRVVLLEAGPETFNATLLNSM